MVDPNRLWRGALNEVAEDVWYLPIVMANVYFLGKKNGPWVLVDAGVRGGGWRIKQAAMDTFGQAPECIVLTHGHFDHIGGLPQLAQEWNVPVYAHALETPFLNGSSDYPPPGPHRRGIHGSDVASVPARRNRSRHSPAHAAGGRDHPRYAGLALDSHPRAYVWARVIVPGQRPGTSRWAMR
jgi:glyoxylase-like metal-dependent hydrolase (beta-lactamase superfamily II)